MLDSLVKSASSGVSPPIPIAYITFMQCGTRRGKDAVLRQTNLGPQQHGPWSRFSRPRSLETIVNFYILCE